MLSWETYKLISKEEVSWPDSDVCVCVCVCVCVGMGGSVEGYTEMQEMCKARWMAPLKRISLVVEFERSPQWLEFKELEINGSRWNWRTRQEPNGCICLLCTYLNDTANHVIHRTDIFIRTAIFFSQLFPLRSVNSVQNLLIWSLAS